MLSENLIRKAMEQKTFLIAQLAGEGIMLKRINSTIHKCFFIHRSWSYRPNILQYQDQGPIFLQRRMAQKSLAQNLLISFSKIPLYLLIWLWSKLVKQVSQFDWRGLGKQLEQWLVSSSVTSSLQMMMIVMWVVNHHWWWWWWWKWWWWWWWWVMMVRHWMYQ